MVRNCILPLLYVNLVELLRLSSILAEMIDGYVDLFNPKARPHWTMEESFSESDDVDGLYSVTIHKYVLAN